MRICRYNFDRLGVVEEDAVVDITGVIDRLPLPTWPPDIGDPVIRHLRTIVEYARNGATRTGTRFPIDQVQLNSPVARPSKIIAAPLNFATHVVESARDKDIHHNTHATAFEGYATPIDKLGLFLKAASSVCGPSEPVTLVHRNRRTDPEVELAVVLGSTAKEVAVDDAFDHVAGYCIGLDMTVRGPEDRSFRKSPDGYTVLGPYMVTADEIGAPEALEIGLNVNGSPRQLSNTRHLTVGIADLISLASRWYTLYPGDVILTGTPDGVAPVVAGDVMDAWIEGIGHMCVEVA